MKQTVFQEWIFALPMQQQSVLVLALRGPDGIAKHHPCKGLTQRYRAAVLKAAYLGRAMRVDEFDKTTFMSLAHFSSDEHWLAILRDYMEAVDTIPHHAHLHFMHGAQIIGYKHPTMLFRERWLYFYSRACDDLHLNPETEAEMDARLNDWNREHWALDGGGGMIAVDEAPQNDYDHHVSRE